MSRDDADRVADSFLAIEAINVAERVMTSHDGDDRLKAVCIDAITYRVFTIGEATKELSPDAKDAHPNVPWSNIAKMLDLIGHHCYRRDPEIIFATIREPLTQLAQRASTRASSMCACEDRRRRTRSG